MKKTRYIVCVTSKIEYKVSIIFPNDYSLIKINASQRLQTRLKARILAKRLKFFYSPRHYTICVDKDQLMITH